MSNLYVKSPSGAYKSVIDTYLKNHDDAYDKKKIKLAYVKTKDGWKHKCQFDYDNPIVTSEGTCLEDELGYYLCPCGREQGYTGGQNPNNHIGSLEQSEQTVATCCTPGEIKYTYTCCGADGYTEILDLDPWNHEGVEGERVITPSTCKTQGSWFSTYTCCGQWYGDGMLDLDPNNHENSVVEMNVKEPTCGEEGSYDLVYPCCGTVLETITIPATGEHSVSWGSSYIDGQWWDYSDCSDCGSHLTDGEEHDCTRFPRIEHGSWSECSICGNQIDYDQYSTL